MLTSASVGANINATSIDSATLKITDAKLYVPVVILSAEDNTNQNYWAKGLKKSTYWNEYELIDNIIP